LVSYVSSFSNAGIEMGNLMKIKLVTCQYWRNLSGTVGKMS
jgi:hypothetical protein